jgi:hypothetical protein
MSETQNPVKFNIRRRTPAPHRKSGFRILQRRYDFNVWILVCPHLAIDVSSGHVRQSSETPHFQLFDAGIPVDLARSWMQRRPVI